MTDTMVTKLEAWAKQAPDQPAIHGGRPDLLTTWRWAEYVAVIRSVGRALTALGVGRGEPVAIIGNNRPEWLFADFGAIAAGAVPAPVYVTNTAEQVAWVIRHCEAKVVIADSAEQYEKLAAQRADLPNVTKVVLMDDVDGADPDWTIRWRDFLALGDTIDEAELHERMHGAAPDDLALLCYTSGTTGEPKGVMITHRGLEAIAQSMRQLYPYHSLGERTVSYLPLCHIAEHMMTLGLQAETGSEVFMCADLAQVKDFLPVAKPTLFLAVPRVWEKFEAALRAKLGEATGVKAKLASWALATEFSGYQNDLKAGHHTGGIQRTIANQLVVSKVKQALGLADTWLCLSGSAPMNPKTADFFASLGLPIHDVYGMTETTAVLTASPLGQPKSGAVGKPIPGVELRFAEDGEILARGAGMTPGYFRNPQQTSELIDADGWLHTGDVGHLDDDGYLRITDRKKDLFKTSGGKYVAPQMLEARLKTIRGIGQAVAVGDGRKFIAALVTLDPEIAPVLAGELGVTDTAPADLTGHPAIVSYVDEQVELLNGSLARFEQVKKVAVLPRELSVEAGELTPTLKLKRRTILANHAGVIEGLFADTITL